MDWRFLNTLALFKHSKKARNSVLKGSCRSFDNYDFVPEKIIVFEAVDIKELKIQRNISRASNN